MDLELQGRSVLITGPSRGIDDEERGPELPADLPFGGPTLAEQTADIAVYLASARASHLGGLVIDADGGAMYR
jgi:3-oxoacyl-[acyl-carrier protein] reductase